MGETKLYSLVMPVNFVMFDQTGMTPNKGNVLLKRMTKALKNFRFQNEFIKANTSNVGDFDLDQKNPNLVIGSWKVGVDACDSNEDGGAVQRHNNDLRRLIGSAFLRLNFHRYQSIIKVVTSHDELGDLTIPGETKETTMADAQLAFYGRFHKAVMDYPFVGKTLILDKEIKRITGDRSMPEDVKKKLLDSLGRATNSLKQNMKKRELAEYNYFAISLDLAVSL